ncbi:MAG: OmpA family protein [Bacteroidia bacterium]
MRSLWVRHRWLGRLGLLILVLCSGNAIRAQQVQWTQHTLSNGLTLRHCQDTTRKLMHLGLTMRGGTRMDSMGRQGLAHLYERLFFQDLPDQTPIQQAPDQGIFTAHNTQIGSHFFGISLDGKQMRLALQMLASGLMAETWSDSAIATAKSGIANILQQQDLDPGQHLDGELRERLWRTGAPIRNRLGNYADILLLQASTLARATRPFRQPANCMLAATSPEPADSFFAAAEAALGSWESSSNARISSGATAALGDNFYFTVVNEFANQPTLMVAWPVPMGKQPDITLQNALSFCQLANLRQGHLYRSVVATGLATRMKWSFAGGAMPGQLMVRLQPVRDSLARCIQALHDGLWQMSSDGAIRKEDVAAANRQVALQAAHRADQSMGRLMAAGEAWLLNADIEASLPSMTAERLRAFCSQFITQQSHIAGLLLNSSDLAIVEAHKDFHAPSKPTAVIAAANPQPKVEPVTTPVPKTEPIATTVTDPKTEPMASSVTEPKVEPVPDPKTDPASDPIAIKPRDGSLAEAGGSSNPKTEPSPKPEVTPKAAPDTLPAVVAKPEDSVATEITTSIAIAAKSEDPAVLRSYRLYFESQGINLTPGSLELLVDVANMLKAHPDKRVFLNSYTEGDGDGVQNYQFSVTRAKQTRQWLHDQLGVEMDQVVIRAYGEAFPEFPGESDLRNRRITLDYAPQDATDNAF